MNGRGSSPLRVTLLFFSTGCLWIFLSDLLLARLVDPADHTVVSTYKGWTFISASAILLYALLTRHFNVLNRSEQALIERNQELAAIREDLQKLNNDLEQRVIERTAEVGKLNEDLQRRAVQLQEVNKELEAFSFSVSHDLRTPLRHIDGFSKALQEDCSHLLDEDGKMYVHRVRVAAQRMEQLIHDIIKLANVGSGELVSQRVNLSSLARVIALELQQSQQGRKVVFIIEEGVVASGDPRLLRVMLANLMENAWKYTAKKDVAHIEFGTVKDASETTYFVKDDGAGFDMAYASKLFTTFQRLHGVEEFEGNGIGLATVQRVVRRHGGRIWGEGAVGKGATFFFTVGLNDTGEVADCG